MDKKDSFEVFFMVVLLAFAVVLVDERWLRTAVAVLPALVLAQRALGMSNGARTAQAPEDERRRDEEIRTYIDRLLKHFREFYATCHLVGARVLTTEAAEERANNLEKELNKLLAEIIEAARTRAAPSQ
ncbi:MAG TPA: hypothetical protein VLA36_10860 [Longimicrobiales bacterium]|nr:hypothetical protein [Longimicrobiales bacterium]